MKGSHNTRTYRTIVFRPSHSDWPKLYNLYYSVHLFFSFCYWHSSCRYHCRRHDQHLQSDTEKLQRLWLTMQRVDLVHKQCCRSLSGRQVLHTYMVHVYKLLFYRDAVERRLSNELRSPPENKSLPDYEIRPKLWRILVTIYVRSRSCRVICVVSVESLHFYDENEMSSFWFLYF